MGKYATIYCAWTQSIDAAIEAKGEIRASCDTCGAWRDVDLAVVRAAKGGDYSLMNKRTRCKLRPGCKGWVRFLYLNGVYRRLWDDSVLSRWNRNR